MPGPADRRTRTAGAAGDAGAERRRLERRGLRLERARSVASSLDLRGARVDEALEALDRYLDDASLAASTRSLIIHGLGTARCATRSGRRPASHPLVKAVRAGERGEGGDGASIVTL